MLKSSHFWINIFSLCFLLASCGQGPEDKRRDAILAANFYLTTKQCDSAIRVLEEAGRDNLNATYLRILSSAYACKGNFDAVRLFADDLALFASPAPIGGSTRFSTSGDMTTPTDVEYTNMLEAINLLLYAGGIATDTEPVTASRAGIFNSVDAAEINMQLVYMLMAQIGRFLKYYGDASTTGVKGGGVLANTCFINYDNVDLAGVGNMETYLTTAGVTGSCTSLASGNSLLGAPGSYNLARMCQGVVLINQFFNIFPAVLTTISGTDFPWITNIETIITTAKNALEIALPGTLARTNVLSQANCETLNAADDRFIQVYYAFMMETLFQ